MKRILLIVFLLVVTTAFAVDMKGKIGLGTGTTRFGDILKPSLFAMRFGVSKKMLIEPWLDITKASLKIKDIHWTWAGPDTWWKPYDTTDYELSVQNKGLGAQALYAFKSNVKSNLYGIGGVILGLAELKGIWKERYNDTTYTYTSAIPIKYLIIPLGIGGERFLLGDYFSININVKSGVGFLLGKSEDKEEENNSELWKKVEAEYTGSLLNFGNSFFNLYFMWYF